MISYGNGRSNLNVVKAHIHTPEQSIDLYTPILTKIKVSTPISVNKY